MNNGKSVGLSRFMLSATHRLVAARRRVQNRSYSAWRNRVTFTPSATAQGQNNVKNNEVKEETGASERAGLREIHVWQRDDLHHAQADWLAEEVPVALVYNGISHVVMMTTPKDLEAFAVGFSLSEGIIDSPADIFGMDVVTGCHGIEVQIELSSRLFYGAESPTASAGRPDGLRRMWRGATGADRKAADAVAVYADFSLAQLDSALAQLKDVQPVGQKQAARTRPPGYILRVD